ncbi:transitional endoplasmic reticulum ATPase [Caballeronia udeis]|uniref:Transitional endoplasmic reticulum ATPase n=1 Tax=Caballeronia udeis TaxID=1232866 RepID=A0ABW8MYR0_9BURK
MLSRLDPFWMRIGVIVGWAYVLLINIEHRSSFGLSMLLLATTWIAFGAVWFWKQGHPRYIQGACAILGLGGLVLFLDWNLLSLPGAASSVAAVYWLHTHVGLANVGSAQPAPSVATQSPPKQAAAAAPAYRDNMRTPCYTFSDIVGMNDTKQRLRAAAAEILAGGPDARNGMLLFGEPGNGKTLFAEALAGDLKVPFFSISYGDVASKWINDTPQNIRAVFQAARRMGRGVLFIDEVDSFLKNRSGGLDGSAGHSMDRDMTNTMLTEIVALRGTKVILVAATNLLDEMDGAGIREGRFDFKVEVPPPDFEARQALLRRGIAAALGEPVIDAEALDSLARRWEGFSAARLTALGKELKDMVRDETIGLGELLTVEMGMQAMRRLQGRAGDRLPEDAKSIDEIIMPMASRDVLRDLAYRLKNAQDLEKINSKIPSGLVFWGAPGTGKTQAAMALAKESGYAFLSVSGDEMMSKPSLWDQKVREALDIRPAIVFIDEAEDILRARKHSSPYVVSLTNKILRTLDGAKGRARDVIYIAATNHFETLDPAIVRGGRFGLKVQFDVPDALDMAIYVARALRRHTEAGYVIGSEVSAGLLERLAGRSIADADEIIQGVIDKAGVRRLKDGTHDVLIEDVEAGVASVRGVEP